jgi:hypothetical protein
VSMLAEFRESKLFKLISDISVIHWFFTVIPGVFAAAEAVLHGKPPEIVILFFFGVCACVFVALHYGGKVWTTYIAPIQKETMDKMPGSLKRLFIPVVALLLVVVFSLWPKSKTADTKPPNTKTTSQTADTAASQQNSAAPPRMDNSASSSQTGQSTTSPPLASSTDVPETKKKANNGKVKPSTTKSAPTQQATSRKPVPPVRGKNLALHIQKTEGSTFDNFDIKGQTEINDSHHDTFTSWKVSGAQPTYSVTNPVGSIVNQGSSNYGTQTVNNAPPSRVLDEAHAGIFQSALANRHGTLFIFPDGTDVDVIPLATQICNLFRGHGAINCVGIPGSATSANITLPIGLIGIHCYVADEYMRKAFDDSGLGCLYENTRFGDDAVTVAPAIVIGNAH